METINQGTFAYDLFEYVNMPVAKSGEKGDMEYEVTVKTGDVMFAGTDADIFITVVGDKGATKCQPLNYLWRNDFERGNKEVYTFEDIDVGKFEFIIIKQEEASIQFFDLRNLCCVRKMIGDNEWFLEWVEVKKTGERRKFPHNQWVQPCETPFFFIQCEESRLPQHDTQLGRASRIVQAGEILCNYIFS